MSQEIITIKKALTKAQEEASDVSEDGTPSPQLMFSDQSDCTVLQFINDKKWSSALKFIKHNRFFNLTFFFKLYDAI